MKFRVLKSSSPVTLKKTKRSIPDTNRNEQWDREVKEEDIAISDTSRKGLR